MGLRISGVGEASGKSSLSPRELEEIQRENKLMQQDAYNQQKKQKQWLIGGGILAGALILYRMMK